MKCKSSFKGVWETGREMVYQHLKGLGCSQGMWAAPAQVSRVPEGSAPPNCPPRAVPTKRAAGLVTSFWPLSRRLDKYFAVSGTGPTDGTAGACPSMPSWSSSWSPVMGEEGSSRNQAVVGTELDLPRSQPAAGKWEIPRPSRSF